jgi:predicted secreted protein
MSKKSKGTLFQVGDGNPVPGAETFLTIGRVFNIGEVKTTRETIDVTTHDSPDDFKEFIGGLRDAGSVAIQYRTNPDDAGQAELQDVADSDERRNFRIVFPQLGYRWAFSAIVTETGTAESSVEGVLNGATTVKISGRPVWEAVS